MPELPEVETVKKALNKYVINKTIKDVIFLKHNIVKENENTFKKSVINKKILSLERIGKFLIFHLEKDMVIISHLRMEGKWIPGKNINDKSKYARVIFIFKDKTILNYDDSRMFGILLTKRENNYKIMPPLSLLGQEAISNINVKEIYPLIHKDKRKIKEVLLDQHIISGLGNIYVDETLFASKISPLSDANKLSVDEIKTILINAKKILLSSIKNNGSTIHSFTWDQGKSGGFQKFLKVYGKKNKLCPNCKTPFIKIAIGGRGTTYCPHCQKRKTDKYVLGITGTIGSGKTTVLHILESYNYKIYSSDEAVNKLYYDKEVKNKLNKLFKTSEKNKIRELVKNNNKNLTKLENLIHPIIKKEIQEFIKKNKGNIAIEVPLLFETNLDKVMDETLFVDSKQSDIFIKARGEKAKAQKTIYSMKKHNYKNKATYLINNDSSIKELKKKLNYLFNK